MEEDFLVFDLETQRDAKAVGGWGYIDNMLLSVAVVWDSAKNKFFTYYEDQVQQLFQHLTCGLKVIGYNHIYFDYKVLSGYENEINFSKIEIFQRLIQQKNFDLLIDIKDKLGFRLKLDGVAKATLGNEAGKSADGLEALQWFKEYKETGDKSKLEKIRDYCEQDVKITKDLYLYGVKNRFIYYETKSRNIEKLHVEWDKQVTAPNEESKLNQPNKSNAAATPLF